ncbi:MAG TPA: hypothetical protein VMT35_03690 [Ignavibacteriaceae bacterium]|nr:hypothetical protein [Ignavibacteriaceae bacterium]
MNKTITHIRDLDLIEKELNSAKAGTFAFFADEKICQTAAAYVYMNKNIYIFLNENEEIHFNIKLSSETSFTVLKYEKKKSSRRVDSIPFYSIFSVSLKGTAKNVTDQKLIDEVTGFYMQKYGINPEPQASEIPPAVKIILIDTQEIQAFEEIGG